jgi:VWFA-related protein
MKRRLLHIAMIVGILPALCLAQQPSQPDQETKPIIYGLVIDASKSIGSQFKDVIEAAKTIVNNNKPGDKAFVVRFVDSSHIETLQDFTSDKAALLDALGKLYTDLGQSAVTDAVYVSAQAVAKETKADQHRPALILITDGDDRASYYKQEQLFALLRENKVRVFVIGLVNQLNNRKVLLTKSSREKAIKFLQRLAQESGGRTFFLESSAELSGITNAIVSDLRQ